MIHETRPYVSTGQLPSPVDVRQIVERAHMLVRDNTEGERSQVYPALARAQEDLFGICIAATNGETYGVGDMNHEFTLMSISKPFVFALICEQIGPAVARQKLGVNATGSAFNSAAPLERNPGGHTNPMVNSGAMATTSLAPGDSAADKWDFLRAGLSEFAGRELALDDEVFASASTTNFRNRGLAQILHGLGGIYCDPMEAVDLYTRQCCLNVTARDLAVMGATLASGGVNPVTRQRVIDPLVCHHTLAVMATAGLYETSGDWLYEIGLPGKSGISGGIVAVSPGKGGLGTFAPLLDTAGNSIKGQLVAKYLSQHLGLDLFVSSPAQTSG